METIGFAFSDHSNESIKKFSQELPENPAEAVHKLAGNVLALRTLVGIMSLVLVESQRDAFHATVKDIFEKIRSEDSVDSPLDRQVIAGVKEQLQYFSEKQLS